MAGFELIKQINDTFGDRVSYLAYNIVNTKVSIGLPPVYITEFEYVWAQHNVPQIARIGSMTGRSVFVSNRNKSGIIEIATLGESVSSAAIDALGLTGIPFPIAIEDTTTNGTSFARGVAARQVGTPQWRREKFPNFNIYTFAVDELSISNGLRQKAS